MLNQRRCCHCGQAGSIARVVNCQDRSGELLGYLCFCIACDESLSPDARHERVLDHIRDRIATQRLRPTRDEHGAWREREAS